MLKQHVLEWSEVFLLLLLLLTNIELLGRLLLQVVVVPSIIRIIVIGINHVVSLPGCRLKVTVGVVVWVLKVPLKLIIGLVIPTAALTTNATLPMLTCLTLPWQVAVELVYCSATTLPGALIQELHLRLLSNCRRVRRGEWYLLWICFRISWSSSEWMSVVDLSELTELKSKLNASFL